MKKLLLVLLALPFIGFGQNVNIPDANFKAYLLGNTAINTNGDGHIQVTEASVFNGAIDCGGMTIYNLTGIEAFTALTWLWCSDNQLTSLNLSQNTALTYLSCYSNQLTSLDVSGATALTTLYCSYNQLTSLNVSQNTALTELYCYYNQLTSLNVSGATALTTLWCYENQLECLDISNNPNLSQLYCSNNLLEQLNTRNGNWVNGMVIDADTNNLTCVEVDNLGYANSSWGNTFDSFVSFSNYTNPCVTVSAIQEQTTNKELLKVTDLLGRETPYRRNTPLFYIYNDGTVEKKIIIE
jgi:Leucine-rich repeat (LRR) protein